MTKKIAARIISNTDKEEYADVEALKQIRITRHNIILANRRIPLPVCENLVQVVQQMGLRRGWNPP